MKKNLLWLLILGILLGYSAPVWADAQNFPVNFATSFTGGSTSTLIKVEGSELRVSVNSLQNESIQDYLVDAESGTIAQSHGTVVNRGGAGWQNVHSAVLSYLTAAKNGLSDSGDAENASSLDSTISYFQRLA